MFQTNSFLSVIHIIMFMYHGNNVLTLHISQTSQPPTSQPSTCPHASLPACQRGRGVVSYRPFGLKLEGLARVPGRAFCPGRAICHDDNFTPLVSTRHGAYVCVAAVPYRTMHSHSCICISLYITSDPYMFQPSSASQVVLASFSCRVVPLSMGRDPERCPAAFPAGRSSQPINSIPLLLFYLSYLPILPTYPPCLSYLPILLTCLGWAG